MDIFNAFATDMAKEDQGVECQLDDAFFTIGRANNTAYNRVFMELYEKHRQALDMKNAESERISKVIDLDVTSKTVLLGWKGTVTFKGESLSYSVANARLLLEVKDFRSWVMKQANNFELYRVVQEEADTKKSVTTSDGTLSGEVVFSS
jgi:hypothetical protein